MKKENQQEIKARDIDGSGYGEGLKLGLVSRMDLAPSMLISTFALLELYLHDKFSVYVYKKQMMASQDDV